MQILRNLGIFSFSFILSLISLCASQSVFPQELLVVTVATEATDGFIRLNRSLNIHGLKSEVFGLGQPWKGGELATGFGGGHKVNLLKDGLEKYSKNRNLVILFIDSYDVIINSKPQKILERFMAMGAKVLFAAEDFCWPDASLAKQYPNEETIGHRYLNSGGFIGFAPEVYGIVSSSPIKDTEDDQLFYTKIYLDKEMRDKWAIKLDHKAQIFQNLQGAVGDVELRFNDDGYAEVYNSAFHSEPVVIHGNGLSKTVLNSLGNYIAKSWSPKHGCLSCKDDLKILEDEKPESFPSILMGIFITHPTPFLDLFFKRIFLLKYPKKKISVIIYNKSAFHDKFIEEYVKGNFTDYQSVEVLPSSINQEWQARNMALERCIKNDCDYYFSIDSDARLTNPNSLTSLIKQNRKVIAPLLVRPKKLWSNFWGALSADGYYSRSHDYIDIVKNERRGVWNVPHLSECLLVNGQVLRNGLERAQKSNQIDSHEKTERHLSTYPTYQAPKGSALDPDMAFSFSLRKNGIFLYVTNLEDFGHLVNSEPYETSHVHNDLYEIFNNQVEWQEKYIHENYSQVLQDDFQLEQPCPDVYWFPIVTPLYCKHLVEEAENYGKWSDGSSYDPRLAGGYENVPTVDIHMNQIGLEQQWLFFLREYIRPVQEKVFVGYFHDPPKASMNFIVRYKPTEQSFLKPHHDTSTYTINVALNRFGIDYEGGGCRFTRYNCSVVDLRQGWTLMHPGKLTHQHEGLTVTSGTRYIMVSFVDP